jgi:hypothetical protein
MIEVDRRTIKDIMVYIRILQRCAVRSPPIGRQQAQAEYGLLSPRLSVQQYCGILNKSS